MQFVSFSFSMSFCFTKQEGENLDWMRQLSKNTNTTYKTLMRALKKLLMENCQQRFINYLLYTFCRFYILNLGNISWRLDLSKESLGEEVHSYSDGCQ